MDHTTGKDKRYESFSNFFMSYGLRTEYRPKISNLVQIFLSILSNLVFVSASWSMKTHRAHIISKQSPYKSPNRPPMVSGVIKKRLAQHTKKDNWPQKGKQFQMMFHRFMSFFLSAKCNILVFVKLLKFGDDSRTNTWGATHRVMEQSLCVPTVATLEKVIKFNDFIIWAGSDWSEIVPCPGHNWFIHRKAPTSWTL